MSLNENGGQTEGTSRESGDSLLPLDFQDPSAAKKKPVPLGEFMKKPDGQGSKANPIPLTPKKLEPQSVQPQAEEVRKPIPLTPKKVEVQEPQAAAPQVEEARKPIPLTPKKVEVQEPQAAAPQVEEVRKPIPLTPKKVEVQEPQAAAPQVEEARNPIPLAPKKAETAPAPEAESSLPSDTVIKLATLPQEAEEDIPDAIPQPPAAAQEPPKPLAQPIPLKPVHHHQKPAMSPLQQPAARQTHPKTINDKEIAARQVQARNAEKAKQQERPPKPSPPKLSNSMGGISKLQDASLGSLMQSARVAAGMSIPQVENITRIKKSYLEALEADNAKNLPPPVFVSAYIRTLCSVYNINQPDVEVIQEKLKALSAKHEVPEALIQNLEKDGQVNMAEEMRVRRALIYIACGFALLILMGLSWYGAVKLKQSKELARASANIEAPAAKQAAAAPSTAAANAPAIGTSPAFNPAAFDRFVVIQNPTMTELKVPGQQKAKQQTAPAKPKH